MTESTTVDVLSEAECRRLLAELQRVAFEVDGVERWNHGGWSVLVQGFGQDVSDAIGTRYEDLGRRGLTTWLPGERSHWVTIDIQRISGRRIATKMGITREVMD